MHEATPSEAPTGEVIITREETIKAWKQAIEGAAQNAGEAEEKITLAERVLSRLAGEDSKPDHHFAIHVLLLDALEEALAHHANCAGLIRKAREKFPEVFTENQKYEEQLTDHVTRQGELAELIAREK